MHCKHSNGMLRKTNQQGIISLKAGDAASFQSIACVVDVITTQTKFVAEQANSTVVYTTIWAVSQVRGMHAFHVPNIPQTRVSCIHWLNAQL